MVYARNVNGKIKGQLTCRISSKNYKFDMNPSQTKKTNIDVMSEISRLFFTMKKTKNGKDTLTLLTKDSIEETERFKCFLVKLKGSFLKHINIDVEYNK